MRTRKVYLIILLLFFAADDLQALDSNRIQSWTLSIQLLQLATENDFEIQGIEKTEEFQAKPASGDLEFKISQLLSNFNYVVIRNDQGQIEQLIVLAEKPSGPKQIILATQKSGDHHVLDVSIKGHSHQWITVRLLIDTGADRIVLPDSLMEDLGYIKGELDAQKLQTANGVVDSHIGYLEAVEFGHEIISNAKVAFVRDELLADNMLLGMDILSRYRMTLDNEAQQITLIKQ